MKVLTVITALLLVGCIASPCAGADNANPSLTTLSKTSQALLGGAARERPQQSTQQATPAATDSNQFFKTKKGATVVGLLVAGFAYTLYSKFHDEIKSPIREQ